MKKIIIIASLALMALLIVSCNGKQNGNDLQTPENSKSTQTGLPETEEGTEAPQTTIPPSSTPTHLPYLNITGEEAKKIMDSGVAHIILDVRTEAEYATSHIEGAILIPHTEIEAKAPSMLPDKDALILVYCRSGNRSKTASQTLLAMGYTNIREFGGINDWQYGTVS